MGQKRRELLIACALAVVFVAFLSQNVFSKKKKTAAPVAEAVLDSLQFVDNVAVLNAVKLNDQLLATQEQIWFLGWQRDPFFPDQTAGFAGPVALTGIVWDEKKPIAMVNDQVLAVGDQIQGYTVTRINRDAIVLEANGQEITVSLFQETEG
jgi:type II secretory pathway component PulC